MRRSVVWMVVLILQLLSMNCLAGRVDASSGELTGKVQPCTVKILVYDTNGKAVSQGSGFLFKSPGRLITNYHVLGNAAMAKVVFHDGREFSIRSILAGDRENDVVEAQVDVPPSAAGYLLPASIPPRKGDRVTVIGSPMGVEKAISDGIVLAIQEISGYGRAIVHSAHSFPGSSGSPLVNVQGEVVGIESGGIPGRPDINFAIPLERFSSMPSGFRQLKAVTARVSPAEQKNSGNEAVEMEKQATESGDPIAQLSMARRYEQGRGVGKNCSEALRLYRKSAEGGDVHAQYSIGRFYYDGKCIGQNCAEAAKWLQKAAERGLAEAQRTLGIMNYNGEGMPRDTHRACVWMLLAASRKDADAQKLLKLMAAEMTRDEFMAAQEKARGWKPAR